MVDCGGMADNEALSHHRAIVEYESNCQDFTAKFERMYGPLSVEERSGWRRCYVALVRAEATRLRKVDRQIRSSSCLPGCSDAIDSRPRQSVAPSRVFPAAKRPSHTAKRIPPGTATAAGQS